MIYRALVRDSRDPSKKGRIKVAIPQVSGNQVTDWIWPLIGSGFMVTPKAGEQVWVAFEAGDKENPVWLGKTAVTKEHKTDTGAVGDVSKLLDRVKKLETDVATLKTKVATLENKVATLESKAHTH